MPPTNATAVTPRRSTTRRSRALLLAALLFAPASFAATLVVGNKSDDTVDLIDLATGESYATLPTGNAPHEIAVSPDGRSALVTNYGDREAPGSSLTLIDLEAATVVRTIDLGVHTRPHGAVWLAKETVAVTAEGSGHLLLLDPRSGVILRAIATGQQVSHMVAVTPDGRRAFVANIGSGGVTAIDLETGEKLADIATGEGAEGIAVSPDGGEIWVTNRAANSLSVIDPARLAVVATVPCPGFPIRIQITPDGRRALVSAAESGEVVVVDVDGRREILRRRLDLGAVADDDGRLFAGRFGDSPVPVGLVIAPDGATAWVAATQSDAVVVIAPDTLEVRGVLTAGREPDGMAYSPLAPAGAAAKTPSGLDGRALFVETHGCQMCHSVPGAGIEARIRSGKLRGPNLGGPLPVDRQALAAFLRQSAEIDGRQHRKRFAGGEDELAAILGWLGALAAPE